MVNRELLVIQLHFVDIWNEEKQKRIDNRYIAKGLGEEWPLTLHYPFPSNAILYILLISKLYGFGSV